MRRLPKPVVAMVAGYAVGGGHILHLCCDLTIAADNARLRPDRAAGRLLRRRLRRLPPARPVGAKKAKEIWLLCRLYDAEEALEMGLVNAVVPLDDLERETVAWCREMLALSPFALRLAQGELQRPRGRLRRDPAALPRRQPALLRDRGGAGGARRLQGEAPARTSPSIPRAARTHEIWLMAARPRTLPAAIAPVLVGTAAAVQWVGHLPRVGAFVAALIGSIFIQIGTNLANDYSDAKRGADTADRLGPVRVTSAGLVTPQRVLRATWIAFAVAVACGIYLATVAGVVILADRRRLDRRRRPLHRRPAALRLRRPRRGLRLPLLRPGRRQRLLLRPARAARRAAARALDRGRLPRDRDPRRQQRPRPRDRPARRQDDAGGADGPAPTR